MDGADDDYIENFECNREWEDDVDIETYRKRLLLKGFEITDDMNLSNLVHQLEK